MKKKTITALILGGVGLVFIVVSLTLVYAYPARSNPVNQKQ